MKIFQSLPGALSVPSGFGTLLFCTYFVLNTIFSLRSFALLPSEDPSIALRPRHSHSFASWQLVLLENAAMLKTRVTDILNSEDASGTISPPARGPQTRPRGRRFLRLPFLLYDALFVRISHLQAGRMADATAPGEAGDIARARVADDVGY